MYKLGLVSVSFRGETPENIVAAAKGAGLSCIEWGSDVHAPAENENVLKKIVSLCADAGLDICSYGTYFRFGKNSPGELLPYIRAAKILGTDILRLWCGTKGYAGYSPEEFAALAADCRAAAALAEENGVTLCMECHNGTVTDCAEGALRLMTEVGSPAFRMYWQPNQYKSFEENLDYAQKLAPYVRHVHVFNWRGDEKFPLDPADGIWTRYLKALGPDRCLLLEFMPDGSINSLPAEASSMTDIAGRGTE